MRNPFSTSRPRKNKVVPILGKSDREDGDSDTEAGTDDTTQTSIQLSASLHSVEKNLTTEFNNSGSIAGQGASVNKFTKDEFTTLFEACQGGHLEVVKELLIAKPDLLDMVTKDGFTSLHSACHGGHLEVVKELIKAKAKLDIVTKNGVTALHSACRGGHLEVVKELLIAKPDLLDMVTKDGVTALHSACQGGHLEVAKELLIAKPALLNEFTKNEETPLFRAAKNGHLEVVKELVLAGANVNQATKLETTPIFVACQNGHKDVAEFLFNEGAGECLTKKNIFVGKILRNRVRKLFSDLDPEVEKLIKRITSDEEIGKRDTKLNERLNPSVGISRSSAMRLQHEATITEGSYQRLP